jgi:hypothetical protein
MDALASLSHAKWECKQRVDVVPDVNEQRTRWTRGAPSPSPGTLRITT